MRKRIGIASLTVILLAVTALAAPAQLRAGGEDVNSGRQLFIATNCSSCHRVSYDPDLPAATAQGPTLRDLGTRPATEIGALIIARSPTGELWLEAGECGMSSATSRVTLSDVRSIALYLQARAR